MMKCLLTLLVVGLAWPATAGEMELARTFRLENEFLRIELDAQTGAILGITNRKTDTGYTAPRADARPPFIVDCYSANQALYVHDPFEKQSGGFSLFNPETDTGIKGDLTHQREALPGRIKVRKEQHGLIERAVCSYELPGGISLAYTITLTKESPITTWEVTVENHGGEAPSQDQRVYRVAFPVLEGLRIGPKPEGNFLARPYAQGELIPDPASYSFTRPNRSATPINVLTYIGWASMSWMDLYDPAGGGLYLASYDPSFQQVDLEAWPDRASGTVTLDLRTLAFLEPGQRWESQAFAVGVHEGDWHWAADRYREWARAHHRKFTGPDWVRSDCDGWFGTGGPVRYDTYPKMLADARWLGLNYLQIWSEMLENVGTNKSRKAYYCFLLPDPDRGGEKAMTQAVKAVRRAGGHIGFYHNVWTWDAEVGEGLDQWRDQIPRDVKIPQWWGDFRGSASVFPDGSRQAGNFTDGYAGMCPGSRAYQDYVLSWVVDRYVRRYGADAWYFDSLPVTMFGASRICFSDEHGPQRPHGVGRGLLELLGRVSSRARRTVNLALTCETVNDAVMQYNSHALGLELIEGVTRHPKPEIYTYTFPEHAVFSGSCNGAGSGLHYYYPDLKQRRPEDTLNRVFLMGYRFDLLFGSVDQKSPWHQYVRRLVTLRQQIKRDLYDSDFRDTLGLRPLPARVEARVFYRRDGSSLTLTLLDRREGERAPLVLDLDCRTATAGQPFAARSATLYSLDGSVTPLTLDPPVDGRVQFRCPTWDGQVAAVIVRQ